MASKPDTPPKRICGDKRPLFVVGSLAFCFIACGVDSDPAVSADPTVPSASVFTCSPNNIVACSEHAEHLLATEQPELAVTLLEDACDSDMAEMCTKVGLIFRDGGPGVPVNTSRGLARLINAEGRGDPAATHALGVAYRDGIGGEVTMPTAAAAFERGCNDDHIDSCFDLGLM